MLPAAQLKMLRYMRSSENKGSGDGDGDGAGDGYANGNNLADNGLSEGAHGAFDDGPSLPSPTRPGTQHLPHTIHAPLPLYARQQLAEAAKIPIPTPSRRATPGRQANHALPAAPSSPTKTQPYPHSQQRQDQPRRQESFRRARSNSGSSNGNHPLPAVMDQQQQQIWEDSSINSMFAESVATATRPPPRVVNVGRYGNPLAQQRNQQHYERTANAGGDAAELGNDPDVERWSHGPSSRNKPVLKHSKYALRDARGAAAWQAALPERQPNASYEDATNRSPEQRVPPRSESNPRVNSSALVGHRGPEQVTENPRVSLFAAIGAPLNPVPQPPGTDMSDMSESDEAPNQRTPRQTRSSPRGPPAQQPPAVVAHTRALQESSLPRVGGGGHGSHRDKKLARKRRHSPDYDDSMLHSMSYSELRDEPFDHDPSRTAVQAPAVPANLSIEDRLAHFKTKEATSQRHFFTEMSVREWDEAGDWFLEQFAELSNKIREKRQAKRRQMAEFEAEIAERENTVRRKAESIERTLGDLRNEGEGMMRNRVVDF